VKGAAAMPAGSQVTEAEPLALSCPFTRPTRHYMPAYSVTASCLKRITTFEN